MSMFSFPDFIFIFFFIYMHQLFFFMALNAFRDYFPSRCLPSYILKMVLQINNEACTIYPSNAGYSFLPLHALMSFFIGGKERIETQQSSFHYTESV